MHTDGNELAGVLQELFGVEASAALRTCASCRGQSAVGAHPLYHGAGLVLRCPACGDVAAAVVEHAAGYAVTLRGTWLLTR
jgi:hypothetical protein